MERDELRLECLKLAASRTPDFNEGVQRAERYFEFIMDGTKGTVEKSSITPTQGAEVTTGKDRNRPGKG
jgi:hypothetical protein